MHVIFHFIFLIFITFLFLYQEFLFVYKIEKSWITCDRLSTEYIVGVDMFIDFAIENFDNGYFVRCPYFKCKKLSFFPSRTVKDHLFFKGFDESYTIWSLHGETEPDMTKIDLSDQVDPQNM